MTSRINLATKGVTGLLGVLGAISTARNFQQMYVHGTIFPDAERKAEQVVQLGSEIKEWAIDTTNNISLMGIIASISEADSREDISSLTDIEDSLDQIYPDLQDRGRRFGEYARSLRAREAGLGVMKDFFRNLVSVPMGGSTAPNAEAFAMSESLGRLQSVVQRAAVNFESAHTQMQYYGDYLEGLALRANRMSWAIIFTNAAILTNEIERERQLETSIEHERNLNSLSTALTGIDAELNSPICHSDEAEANLRSRREALVSQIELARRANVH